MPQSKRDIFREVHDRFAPVYATIDELSHYLKQIKDHDLEQYQAHDLTAQQRKLGNELEKLKNMSFDYLTEIA